MGAIYTIEKDYHKVLDLYIEAWDISQEICPNTSNAIIQCHSFIGDIYLARENDKIAKEFYLAAFEMSKRTLFTEFQ